MAIRVVYIVPGDAAPWRDARHRATEWLEDVQWFFADEMARLGYGPRTFEIHYTDGAVRFDELNIVNARSEFLSSGRGTPALCLDGARTLTPPGNEDIVVYIHEAYEIRPREVCAPSRGSGRMRAAFLSSLHLKLARREWMSKDDGHAGAVMEWVAPDPMPDLRFWNRRGSTFADLCGAAYGVMTHELGHALGLPHDSGGIEGPTLMGRGLRQMRDYFRHHPGRQYGLSQASGIALAASPYLDVRDLKPRSMIFRHPEQ